MLRKLATRDTGLVLLAILLIALGSFVVAANHVSQKIKHPESADCGTPSKNSPIVVVIENDIWLDVLTALLVASTIGLGIIGYRQFKDSRILQRAYISALPGGVEPFRDGTRRLACNIIIHNAGNLPAQDTHWGIGAMMHKSGELSVIPDPPIVRAGLTVPPRINVIKGISETDLTYDNFDDQCRNGKNWLYIYGKITYRDGLDNPRWIKFCHRYYVVAPETRRISKREGRHHERGNESSDDHASS